MVHTFRLRDLDRSKITPRSREETLAMLQQWRHAQANLERGKIMSFAGFEFIHSERLPTDGSGYRRVLAFQRTGLGLAIAQDPKADITQRKDKRSLPWQAYISLSMAATRLEDSKVVEIKCLAT